MWTNIGTTARCLQQLYKAMAESVGSSSVKTVAIADIRAAVISATVLEEGINTNCFPGTTVNFSYQYGPLGQSTARGSDPPNLAHDLTWRYRVMRDI